MLNLPAHLELQIAAWNSYSRQIADYANHGVLERLTTPEGAKLIEVQRVQLVILADERELASSFGSGPRVGQRDLDRRQLAARFGVGQHGLQRAEQRVPTEHETYDRSDTRRPYGVAHLA